MIYSKYANSPHHVSALRISFTKITDSIPRSTLSQSARHRPARSSVDSAYEFPASAKQGSFLVDTSVVNSLDCLRTVIRQTPSNFPIGSNRARFEYRRGTIFRQIDYHLRVQHHPGNHRSNAHSSLEREGSEYVRDC